MSILDHLGLHDCLNPEINKDNTLFYLIAKGATADEIIKSIAQDTVNRCWVKFGITPLHLAAALGRQDLIEILIQQGAEIDAKDEMGWTPLLFTAFASNPAAELKLRQLGAKDTGFLTVEVAKEKAGTIIRQESMKSAWYLDERGQQKPLDDTFLKKVGVERYTDRAYFTPENYRLLWQELKYIEWREKLPLEAIAGSLIMNKLQHNVFPRVLVKNVPGCQFLGLYAEEEIPALTPLGLYTGKIEANPLKYSFEEFVLGMAQGKDSYRMGFLQNSPLCIDAMHAGSSIRFINDDFPNAGVFCITGMDPIICSLQPIEKGQALAFDYGLGLCSLKWGGNYRLISETRLIKYFQEQSVEAIRAALMQDFEYVSAINESDTINVETFNEKFCGFHDRLSKLLYTITTPVALSVSILSGASKAAEWLALFEDAAWRDALLHVQRSKNYFIWIVSLLYHLSKISVSQKLIRAFDTLTVLEVCKLIQLAARGKEEPLQNYHWQEDEDFPLCRVQEVTSATGEKKLKLLHPDEELKRFIMHYLPYTT
jgi:hypothetical protein